MSRTSRKSKVFEASNAKPKTKLAPQFQSPYSRQLLDSFPQRTRWVIPDSRIVFSSQFCSGNMAKAQRGRDRNCFDIWVSGDASPHMGTEDNYYRTWFYFSVTGVP